jgi:ribonuclease J
MANGTHQQIEIRPGDTVVLSSNPIPGNEKAVFRNINRLVELGANVIHNKIANVHVRGHAAAEELKLVQRIVRPEFILPAQGEYRHLLHHRTLAAEIGMTHENILVGIDGDVFDFGLVNENRDDSVKTVLERSSRIASDYVYIDTHRNRINNPSSIEERKELSTDGLISLTVHISETNHSRKIAVRVRSLGIDYPTVDLQVQIESVANDLISSQQAGISQQALEKLLEEELTRSLKLLIPQRPELFLDIFFSKQ